MLRRRLITFENLYQHKTKRLPPIGLCFGTSGKQAAVKVNPGSLNSHHTPSTLSIADPIHLLFGVLEFRFKIIGFRV